MTTIYLAQLSTDNARTWLQDNVITLVVLFVGIVVTVAAGKQEISKIGTTLIGLVFGLAVLGLGLIPNAAANTAKFVAGLLNIGG
ncbi:hypothetical protein [Pseudonocardia sp. H11422]|uniref:hypothetical protein n=1 Tax=Pseudonocardia sp. H11422 TaxID=2835866 RepID=UPI001BDD732C|nr:hypothetical protein [Pseudonocardia sp. H11422]